MCLAIRVKWYTAVVWDGPHFSGWSSKKQKHMLSPVWLPSLAWTRVHSRTHGPIRNRFSNLWLIPSMIIYDLWTWKSNVEKYPDRTENVSKHVASRRTGIKKKKKSFEVLKLKSMFDGHLIRTWLELSRNCPTAISFRSFLHPVTQREKRPRQKKGYGCLRYASHRWLFMESREMFCVWAVYGATECWIKALLCY